MGTLFSLLPAALALAAALAANPAGPGDHGRFLTPLTVGVLRLARQADPSRASAGRALAEPLSPEQAGEERQDQVRRGPLPGRADRRPARPQSLSPGDLGA